MSHDLDAIRVYLASLYGDARDITYQRLMSLLDGFQAEHTDRSPGEAFVSEQDVILITYGDIVTRPGAAPLATLNDFLAGYLSGTINTVHLLPFFPYSSDDGFSIINYREVDARLGSWTDIHRLSTNFNLMVDLVINHVSAQSRWFQGFLRGEEKYRDYFITANPDSDLSAVVRPRTTPLLTSFETRRGPRFVWTTFSPDQPDLNFANPDVLLAIVDVLLYYLKQGARIIRLDAIAYLWKEVGTSCFNLPQTHTIVKLLRAIVDTVSPGVLLITETNVPYAENVAYFGNGTDESHLVYQFPLPLLIAHTLWTGSAGRLNDWAAGQSTPSDHTAFLNFTATHDGVFTWPAQGLLDDDELNALIEQARASGGEISYKANTEGPDTPYEINIVYYDLINPPDAEEPQRLQVQRYLVSQAIMLALAGVPAIYFHSLVGSRNNIEGVRETGQARTINREKLPLALLDSTLAREGTLRHAVFQGYKQLIKTRIGEHAFHPNRAQHILPIGEGIFGLLRHAPDGGQTIVALHNITAVRQTATLDLAEWGMGDIQMFNNVLSGVTYPAKQPGVLECKLAPYQILWLRPIND